ncbi:MAG: hypothetical protein JXB62_02760 [Pirellulales bacterium]|nr:hypothetical protein [Pirellulales bacterium]
MAHQPTLHNPFPQLSKVAVAPFFVLAEEPTLNGKEVALAYFNELQLVPGFEVVPVGVVESKIRELGITLDGPENARRLAQALDVDAVVVGAVTDFSPWYPPRCGLQVEWYAANPCFHQIPPGYGLPWGTPEEEGIPAPLVFEAEMALAKAQLNTQTPPYPQLPAAPKSPATPPGQMPDDRPTTDWPETQWGEGVTPISHQASCGSPMAGSAAMAEQPDLPPDWPDPRGFIPPPPASHPPTCWPSDAPVLRHTRTYNGHDTEFTEALASYCYFRDDARFGGWQSYLQRSNDFIRFCCHMHISEMLSARGGAGETRVVWRWPTIR